MATPAIYAADAQGFPTQYAQKIENIFANQNGDNVTVTTVANDTLVAIAIGLRANDRFDDFHAGYSIGTGTAAGYFRALPDSVGANPTISDNSGDSVAVTSVTETTTAYTLSAVANSVGSTAVYTGTITGGGSNAYAGYYFTVAGFVGANNNGYFLCTASTALALTLENADATAETHAATATDYVVSLTTASNNFIVGDDVTLSGFVTQTWLNGQTQAVVTAGSVFTVNDGALHASSGPTAQTTAFAARTSGNDWTLIAHANLVGEPAPGSTGGGSDYTPGATPPAYPNPYPASNWSIDGYYPSMYMWAATGVSAGTYKVNLKSVFNNPASTSDLSADAQAAGRPIFDGGVTFLVIRFSGVLPTAAEDGDSIGVSVAAKAAPAAFTTTQGAELLLACGLMKSGNVFTTGHVNQGGTDTVDAVTLLASGKLVGSEAHYAIEMATPASASATTYLYFSNPLGYEMLVGNIALMHS
jgi:hypothetical protein